MAEIRTSAPSKNNKFFYKDNPFYSAGYGLPNCTCWAWGCFYEFTGKKPKLSLGNAENWYTNTSDRYKRGQVPEVGAIACWSKGKAGSSADGAGHVAIVSKVYSDGSILVSESGWKASKTCWTLRLNKGYKRSGYKFQGFIYPGEEPKKEKAASKGDKVIKFRRGKDYVITAPSGLKVRSGPSVKYPQKKCEELTDDGKRHAHKGKYAALKKGTVVTAVSVSGNWIQCPSGWICGKEDNEYYLKEK